MAAPMRPVPTMPVKVVPQQAVQRKIVVAHLDIRLAQPPVGRLGQRHGVLGHGLRAVPRHTKHRYTVLFSRRQVHMIVPGAA